MRPRWLQVPAHTPTGNFKPGDEARNHKNDNRQLLKSQQLAMTIRRPLIRTHSPNRHEQTCPGLLFDLGTPTAMCRCSSLAWRRIHSKLFLSILGELGSLHATCQFAFVHRCNRCCSKGVDALMSKSLRGTKHRVQNTRLPLQPRTCSRVRPCLWLVLAVAASPTVVNSACLCQKDFVLRNQLDFLAGHSFVSEHYRCKLHILCMNTVAQKTGEGPDVGCHQVSRCSSKSRRPIFT